MMNPGTVFTPDAAKRIIRAVKIVERMADIESRPDRRKRPAGESDAVYFLNSSGETVPQYGVIKLTAWGTTTVRYTAERPDATGFTSKNRPHLPAHSENVGRRYRHTRYGGPGDIVVAGATPKI